MDVVRSGGLMGAGSRMRVSVDNPEVNLACRARTSVLVNASGAAGRSSKTPLNMMRAGADMLSSVARVVRFHPHLATWGCSCCPSLAEEEDTHEGHPMSR